MLKIFDHAVSALRALKIVIALSLQLSVAISSFNWLGAGEADLAHSALAETLHSTPPLESKIPPKPWQKNAELHRPQVVKITPVAAHLPGHQEFEIVTQEFHEGYIETAKAMHHPAR